ncbi:MAG: metal-dependent transcriptional regulator [Bacteroidota bacterium]
MKLTKSEEDYLKAIFYLIVESGEGQAGTNQIAEYLEVSPASVNSMLKKLRQKELVAYEKYGKLELTPHGKNHSLQLIRKHRLWETFLYRHMNFTWDEVHDVAEQLEHIDSGKLIDELDRFLGFPKRDPHGSLIPSSEGDYQTQDRITLAECGVGDVCRLTAVKDSSAAFLRYLTQIGLAISGEIVIQEIREFDGSLHILIDGRAENVSKKFAEHIYVEVVKRSTEA